MHVVNNPKDKVPKGKKRSNQWPKVRKAFLAKNPTCALCGGKKKLEVHHKMPFHLHPELELDPKNLITLCENDKGGANCHLLFGHLGNFKSFNHTVHEDTHAWNEKIKSRPKDSKGV
jgi:5-methylcytosine-specific restriction endonuclease McrA